MAGCACAACRAPGTSGLCPRHGRQPGAARGSQVARQPGSQAARWPGSQAARQPGGQAARGSHRGAGTSLAVGNILTSARTPAPHILIRPRPVHAMAACALSRKHAQWPQAR
eukprot:146182-Chlamydomonas_euryale.AAC.3